MPRPQQQQQRQQPKNTHAATSSVRGAGTVRLGFVPLVDAAPLIAAGERGYFADEGLHVTLDRQIGWANVRDKLAFGHLDASHALLGLPLSSVLRDDAQGEELVSVMSLSSGGNAITLSRQLFDAGVNSAATLARYVHDRHRGGDRPLVFGHVFSSSTHHYLLRDWLDAAGVHPDLDVRLCVIPPPQMAHQMAGGHLDGFAVGEPWNTLAARTNVGSVVCPTADILPAHPEKVLATSRRWATAHANVLTPLIRGIVRACNYCNDPANVAELADMLSRPHYIGVDAETIRASLTVDRSFGLNPRFAPAVRPADWAMRSFGAAGTFPSRTHFAWLLEQMIRWGHAAADVHLTDVADRCTDSRAYRRAAESLGLECPADEYPPMPLRGNRTFDPTQSITNRNKSEVPAPV